MKKDTEKFEKSKDCVPSTKITSGQVDLGFEQPSVGIVMNEVSEDGDKGKNPPVSTTEKFYFPSNREHLLHHLGTMAISAAFPTSEMVVATVDGRPAVVPGGLSEEEVSLLSAGITERFPVLAELTTELNSARMEVLGIDQLAALHFRSAEEADEFRFRSVDEVATDDFSLHVSPKLFSLECHPRFVTEHVADPFAITAARRADKVAGAIISLLELGKASPECWHTIGKLLGHPDFICNPALAVSIVCNTDSSGQSTTREGESRAVVEAFIADSRGRSRTLLEAVLHGLQSSQLEVDSSRQAKWRIWFDTADRVLSNQAPLTGNILADGGVIPLRAALVAAMADDADSISSFLKGQAPAGKKLVTIAAALVGFKTGIADVSWTRKKPYRQLLSRLVPALQLGLRPGPQVEIPTISFAPHETLPSSFELYWRDHVLAEWSDEVAQPNAASISDMAVPALHPSAVDLNEWRSMLESAGYEFTLDSSDEAASAVITTPRGESVFLTKHSDNDRTRFLLACPVMAPYKLKAMGEVLRVAATPGLVWRAAINLAKQGTLLLDLKDVPGKTEFDEYCEGLEFARSQYCIGNAKAKAKAKPKTNISANKNV